MFTIISKPGCPACARAKAMLDARTLPYDEDVRDTEEKVLAFIEEGHRTFPRVFLDGTLIGGADDLALYLAKQVEEDF